MLCLPSPRKVLAFVGVIACAGLVAASPALASSHHHKHHHSSHGSSSNSNDTSDSGTASGDSTTSTDAGDAGAPVTGGTIPAATGSAQTVTFRLTGYAKADNTPANSVTISMPVIHKTAGGTGSFADPITAATPGHAGSTESPKGARFYIPKVHRYVIVEDSGASKFSQPHLDVWNGTASGSITNKCESDMTGTFPIIKNPPAGELVHAGPLADATGCHF